MRNLKIIFLLFTCLSFNEAFSAGKPNQDIHNYVQKLIDDAFKILNDNSLSKEQKKLKSEGLMQKNLDTAWMADFSLGRNRKELSQAQLKKFRETYTRYVVKSYAKNVKNYKGEEIIVKEVKQLNEDSFAVKTQILSPSKNNLNIDFMVKKRAGGFFVFDVVTEGASLITAQRSEFNSVINKDKEKGIENLISILEEKISNKKA
jgi:phospholipid transport system substrate-binding protein